MEEGEARCLGPESKEAEEEDWSSIPVRGNGEEKRLTVDGGVTEATGRSSNIWSNAEREDNVHPQKGTQSGGGVISSSSQNEESQVVRVLKAGRKVLLPT